MRNFFLSLIVCVFVGLNVSCVFKPVYRFNSKNPKIALVVSGALNDSTWNQSAYEGLKRFKGDHKNITITVVERVDNDSAQEVLESLAKNKYDLVLAHGYNFSQIAKEVAQKNYSTFYCVIGGSVNAPPNLCSFNFKDDQYGYLLGIVAGLNTATNKVGIVVGKKLPSIERTIIGLRKGLKTVNPKADLVVSYIDTWSDTVKSRQAAINQINTGVDVITHLADTAGVGVIKAAEEADISAIGSIIDQHDIAPTTVIGSVIQDASQLAFLACEKYVEKTLTPLVYRFGLKDQVIDLSPTYGNIDPNTESRINKYKNYLLNIEVKQEEAAILENKSLNK